MTCLIVIPFLHRPGKSIQHACPVNSHSEAPMSLQAYLPAGPLPRHRCRGTHARWGGQPAGQAGVPALTPTAHAEAASPTHC